FFGVIDVGNEDAIRSQIERLLNAGTVVVSPHSDQRLGSAVGDATEHGGKFFVSHGAVLRVDQKPVVAAVRELFRESWAVGVEEQSHLRISCAQLFFKIGSAQGGFGHDVVPPWKRELVVYL